MPDLYVFQPSLIENRGARLWVGRYRGRDVLLAQGDVAGLTGGEALGDYVAYPAGYEQMLAWEQQLAPGPHLAALNEAGYGRGFGAGNRMVVAWDDGPSLSDPATLAGWDGIYRAMAQSAAPFWFIQQSIVRELIPEGVDPADYPGIGHTGGYGPRELLRAGLFAFAAQGGYSQSLPIGADADHAIITGHDEESLAASVDFNKLAISEAREYTKFTVDTSHLFGFPVSLSEAERRRLLGALAGRHLAVPNILPGRPSYTFTFDEEETLRLGRKYWQACMVHKAIYDHVASVRGGRPFDYELSLDETPEPTPPRDLLFYLLLLEEVMGLPKGGVASAGPNIGFIKRHDYEGTLEALWAQTNAAASILHARGAMLSVHSADGVRAETGKGPGVDEVIRSATGGLAELKVADVYQEVLWQVLERLPEPAEREVFDEAWRRTYEAVRQLAAVYRSDLAGRPPQEAERLLVSPAWQAAVAAEHGDEALALVQGVRGYGLPLFNLAADLLAATDPALPSAEAELFRRFMFLPYRSLRPQLFGAMTHAGWERLAAAIEEATMTRLRAMGWQREGGDA